MNDSETNLKIKQALPETVHLITPLEASHLGGCIRSEQPNNSLYTFEGTLLMNSAQGNPKELPLDPTQVLLRVRGLKDDAGESWLHRSLWMTANTYLL